MHDICTANSNVSVWIHTHSQTATHQCCRHSQCVQLLIITLCITATQHYNWKEKINVA